MPDLDPTEDPEGVTTKIVHFTITGEFITSMAREMLLDDEPGKAYRLIADSLIGDGSAETALCVLRGTHNLAGDSSTRISVVEVKDDADIRSFNKGVRRLYAGRHRRDGAWWRPVARVVHFNQDDAEHATDTVGELTWMERGTKWRWYRARTDYYCMSGEAMGEHETELPSGEKCWVIWEPCGEPPHWARPSVTEQEALDEALKAGRPFDERVAGKSQAQIDREDELETELAERQRQVDRDAEYAERQRRFDEQVIEIGKKVREQAGDDTIELDLDGRKLTVPRAPFARWALYRTDMRGSMPEWENVSPVGMKLPNDSPDHTDWVLGSGLTLEEAYEDEMKKAAWDAAFDFQEKARKPKPFAGIMAAMEMLSETIHPAAVMVDAGERTGVVGEDIMVLPDSEAARVKQLGDAVGVIVEKCGKLAHFAIVTRGRGITVMRHPDACDLFEPGMRVTLNPKTGRIVVDED